MAPNKLIEDAIERARLSFRKWKQNKGYQYDPASGLFSTYEKTDAWQFKKENYLAEKLYKKMEILKELEDIRMNMAQSRSLEQKLAVDKSIKSKNKNPSKNRAIKEFISMSESLGMAHTIQDIVRIHSKLAPRKTKSQQSAYSYHGIKKPRYGLKKRPSTYTTNRSLKSSSTTLSSFYQRDSVLTKSSKQVQVSVLKEKTPKIFWKEKVLQIKQKFLLQESQANSKLAKMTTQSDDSKKSQITKKLKTSNSKPFSVAEKITDAVAARKLPPSLDKIQEKLLLKQKILKHDQKQPFVDGKISKGVKTSVESSDIRNFVEDSKENFEAKQRRLQALLRKVLSTKSKTKSPRNKDQTSSKSFVPQTGPLNNKTSSPKSKLIYSIEAEGVGGSAFKSVVNSGNDSLSDEESEYNDCQSVCSVTSSVEFPILKNKLINESDLPLLPENTNFDDFFVMDSLFSSGNLEKTKDQIFEEASNPDEFYDADFDESQHTTEVLHEDIEQSIYESLPNHESNSVENESSNDLSSKHDMPLCSIITIETYRQNTDMSSSDFNKLPIEKTGSDNIIEKEDGSYSEDYEQIHDGLSAEQNEASKKLLISTMVTTESIHTSPLITEENIRFTEDIFSNKEATILLSSIEIDSEQQDQILTKSIDPVICSNSDIDEQSSNQRKELDNINFSDDYDYDDDFHDDINQDKYQEAVVNKIDETDNKNSLPNLDLKPIEKYSKDEDNYAVNNPKSPLLSHRSLKVASLTTSSSSSFKGSTTNSSSRKKLELSSTLLPSITTPKKSLRLSSSQIFNKTNETRISDTDKNHDSSDEDIQYESDFDGINQIHSGRMKDVSIPYNKVISVSDDERISSYDNKLNSRLLAKEKVESSGYFPSVHKTSVSVAPRRILGRKAEQSNDT